MLSVLLGLHFALTLAIIGLILLQKHDSDGALGSSGGGAASGMFSVRGQANILTKSTAILMTIFMINCLVMAKIAKNRPAKVSVIDQVAKESVLPVKDKGYKEGQPMPQPPSDLSKLKKPDQKMPQPPSDLSKLKKPEQTQSTPAKNAPAKPTPVKSNSSNPSKPSSKDSVKK